MRLLTYLNLILLLALGVVGALFFLPSKEAEPWPIAYKTPQLKELPKSPFAQSEEAFEALGKTGFTLRWVPPKMHLPDLRQEIVYYGKNLRPDRTSEEAFHICLKGTNEMRSLSPGRPIYLVYEGNQSLRSPSCFTPQNPMLSSQQPVWGDLSGQKTGLYHFSDKDSETPLWIEVEPSPEGDIIVTVSMRDENGNTIQTPAPHNRFSLKPTPIPKGLVSGWKIGEYRVDTTLLVRQKARWIGQDLFLQLHGGEEFSYANGKERIDFLDKNNPYRCYVSAGDYLVWKRGRWQEAPPGEKTQNFPLMVIKKIDEKIISLELWAPEGRGKTLLSLIRGKEHRGPQNPIELLKFVGAKTWAQFIVESKNGERLNLKPNDWVLLTTQGWQKLSTPEEVDEYVEGRLSGPLFILRKMTKENGRQALVGHIFSTSRTHVDEVVLEAQGQTSLANFYRSLPTTPPIKPELKGEE